LKKKYSTSSAIRERKIKTAMRYYLTLIKIPTINKRKIINAVKRRETLIFYWWEWKLVESL
jgi:hypothetical protein